MNNLVRISSLVLFFGMGSLVCYKWLTDKRKNKRLLIAILKAMNFRSNSKSDKSFDEIQHSFSDSVIKRYEMLSSTPFLDLCQSLDATPSFTSSLASDVFFESLDFTDENDCSDEKTPLQKIGSKTVAKLDQLLKQIQDIKQSVYDIDEQIFDVKDSNVKFEPKMFNLGEDFTSSINNESDLNEKFNYLNTEPQTPSLEWDSMDLKTFNDNNGHNFSKINENQTMYSLNSSKSKNQSLIGISKKSNSEELSQSSEEFISISTSGEFSISSASEQSKENDLAVIQNMISEAKELGILKDLIDILVKTKRDSAFFEH